MAERFCGTLVFDASCRLLCDAFNCLDDDEWWCKIGPAESGRYGSGAGGLRTHIKYFIGIYMWVWV